MKKIIHIIPCSQPLYALFKSEEGNFTLPITCLALVEIPEEGGYRHVEGMTADDDISSAEDVSNFAGYRNTPLP